MLKKVVTYEDYNEETVTETLYFNLSKPELVEMEVGYEGGLEQMLQEIIKTNDSKRLIAEFKRLVLLSYGEKTTDGRRFIKSQELRDKFEQSPAYSEVFMELATDAEAAANFVNAIIPKDLAEAAAQAEAAEKLKEATAGESPAKTTAEIAAQIQGEATNE